MTRELTANAWVLTLAIFLIVIFRNAALGIDNNDTYWFMIVGAWQLVFVTWLLGSKKKGVLE